MRYPVLYNPYCQESRFVFSLPRRWALCISGNHLVRTKSFAAFHYMTFGQYISSKHVQTFWVARKPTWYWIKWAAISHKGISEGSLGIMLCTIQKKGFRPNRPIISFAAKSKRRPLVDWRGCRWTPQAIPLRHSPNCHRPAWKSNFGKITMMRKNRSRE